MLGLHNDKVITVAIPEFFKALRNMPVKTVKNIRIKSRIKSRRKPRRKFRRNRTTTNLYSYRLGRGAAASTGRRIASLDEIQAEIRGNKIRAAWKPAASSTQHRAASSTEDRAADLLTISPSEQNMGTLDILREGVYEKFNKFSDAIISAEMEYNKSSKTADSNPEYNKLLKKAEKLWKAMSPGEKKLFYDLIVYGEDGWYTQTKHNNGGPFDKILLNVQI